MAEETEAQASKKETDVNRAIKNIFYGMSALIAAAAPTYLVIDASAEIYKAGQTLYEDNCLICHGDKGNGKGPAAAAMDTQPRDFTNSEFWQQNNVNEKISDAIKNGHGPVPEFDLTGKHIHEIIEYMNRMFKPDE
ncbi:MAG: c-type cytochrome [Syntrophales bacterium]|nr:c-type cytochrome [Syntrophales bacterium]MDY0045725.1 cytochrome c [Syntrophales bacterium]